MNVEPSDLPKMADRKTICLGMIVKNEAPIIIQTINHLMSFINFDYWVINDNGSTDGSQELICNFFKDKKIPGELDETAWKDFGYNRTVVLDRAYNKTDYIFIWDADDEIKGNFVFPSNDLLIFDEYYFTFGGTTYYSRRQLFNNKLHWKYVGVLHEYSQSNENDDIRKNLKKKYIDGDYFFVSGRTGNRSKDPKKYLNDAIILEKSFKEAYEKGDDIYNRYAYYTAQSYKNCDMYGKAIEYYKKVLTLNNWAQEKYISCLEIYLQYERLKLEDNGVLYLVDAYKYDNTRVECISQLVKYYCRKKMNKEANMFYSLIKEHYESTYVKTNDAIRCYEVNYLFMQKKEYDFYLPYFMIIVSTKLGDFQTFSKMYEIIFLRKYFTVGEWWVNNLYYNIQFGIDKLPKTIEFLQNLVSYVKSYNKENNKTLENIKYIHNVVDYYKKELGLDCGNIL